MTSKEAKKILNEYRNRNYTSTLKDEVELAMAIDAVLPKYVELEERDTLKKVCYDNLGRSECPSCDMSYLYSGRMNRNKYCGYCGQRLDWN